MPTAKSAAPTTAGLSKSLAEATNDYFDALRKGDQAEIRRTEAIYDKASADFWGRMNAMAKAGRREMALNRLADKVEAEVRKRLAERKTAEAKQKRLDAERKLAEARIAHGRALMARQSLEGKVKQLKDEMEAVLASNLEKTAELNARLDVVTANAQRGQAMVLEKQLLADRLQEAEEMKVSNDWLYKANSTSDPILRAVYMAKANGEDIADEDD